MRKRVGCEGGAVEKHFDFFDRSFIVIYLSTPCCVRLFRV
jgi:hypothetical protein